MRQYIELFEAAMQTCKACMVKPGENAVIFADTMKNPTMIDAFFNACVEFKANPVLVYAKAYKTMLNDPPKAALKAMMEADIVFDLATQPWLYTESTNLITQSGTRMLQVLADENSVVNRPPTVEISERAERLSSMMKGETIRITSSIGTDFTCKRGSRPIHWQDGCVKRAGEWDSLAVIVAAFAPLETEANGTVVLNGPIYMGPRLAFHVEEPIRFIVDRGCIIKIEGGKQTEIIRQHLDGLNDSVAKIIAHTGFGMDPRADIWADDIGNWESYDGGINVAFGGNNINDLQGKNISSSHIDLILLNSDMTVDGTPVIRNGKFQIRE